MNFAVAFNNEFCFTAIKVDDIFPKLMLTSELESQYFTIP